MSFDFNILNNVAIIPYDDMLTITVDELCKRFNDTVKDVGLEFEESEFTVLLPIKGSDRIRDMDKYNPHVLCTARTGSNEGYYVYVYVSTPKGLTPILSSKNWTWQNMVAIQGVITALLRDY